LYYSNILTKKCCLYFFTKSKSCGATNMLKKT